MSLPERFQSNSLLTYVRVEGFGSGGEPLRATGCTVWVGKARAGQGKKGRIQYGRVGVGLGGNVGWFAGVSGVGCHGSEGLVVRVLRVWLSKFEQGLVVRVLRPPGWYLAEVVLER